MENNNETIQEEKVVFKNYINLPNDLYDNLDITNKELTIYALIQRSNMTWKNNIAICSYKMLCDYMYIDPNHNTTILQTIKDAIQGLIDKKYITNLYDVHYKEIATEDIEDKYFTFYARLQKDPIDHYFKVEDKKMDIIFKHLNDTHSKLSKFSLMRYYIACCRVSHNEQNFGFLSQSKLKSLVTDPRTYQRYNNILQDKLKLIRFCSDYWTQEKHYITTFVGLYEDNIENFNLQLESEVAVKKLVKTDKTACNNKRSTKQKINDTEKKLTETEKDKEIRELKEKLAMLEKEHEEQNTFIPKVKEEVPPSILETKGKGMFKGGKKSVSTKGDKEIVPSPKDDEFADVENETPQGYNEEESWEGNEEDPYADNKKDAVYDIISDKLFKYVKENYNKANNEIKERFATRFDGVDFEKLKGKEIAEMTIKVREFFKEYADKKEKKNNDDDLELINLDAIVTGEPEINENIQKEIAHIKWLIEFCGYREIDFKPGDLMIYNTYIKDKVEI